MNSHLRPVVLVRAPAAEGPLRTTSILTALAKFFAVTLLLGFRPTRR